MTTESKELALYTINTGNIYRGITQKVIKNLAYWKQHDCYDPDLAVKAFEHVAEVGAKQYQKEFGTPGQAWHKMFTVSDRKLAAEEMLEHYMEQITEQSKQ